MTNQNSAQQRLALTSDLHDEIHDLIYEHGRMATFTVAEIIGVLEILKMEILLEQQQPDDEEDEE